MSRPSEAPGTPRVDIHSISRAGQELYREKVRCQGEMYIESGARLFSYDFDIETIQGLVLTVEGGSTDSYFATKWVHNKGMKDNWATVWVWDQDGNQVSGSVWVNFIADGE